MTKRLWGLIALVGAVALSLSAERWQVLLVLGLVGWWWWQKQSTPEQPLLDRGNLSEKLKLLETVIQEINDPQLQQNLTLRAQDIQTALTQTQARVAIVGLKGVGKTAVIRAISGDHTAEGSAYMVANKLSWLAPPPKITLVDTTSTGGAIDREVLNSVELTVLVISADITASEYAYLRDLLEAGHRVLVAINKTDLLLPTDIQMIQQHIVQLSGLSPQDVVSISAQPRAITVKQYSKDSNALVQKWQEPVPPQITALKQRIEAIIAQEWGGLWRKKVEQQLNHAQSQAETALKEQRRHLAHALILRQQRLIALGVLTSPLPTLDMAASLVLNAQLLMEIAQIYELPLNCNQARQMAQNMGLQLLQIGGVEVITTAVSSFLKTNFLTYAVGGAIQGVSAAYFTHLCGISFLNYLEAQPLAVKKDGLNPVPTTIELLPYNLQNWLQSWLKAILPQMVAQLKSQIVPVSTYPHHELKAGK